MQSAQLDFADVAGRVAVARNVALVRRLLAARVVDKVEVRRVRHEGRLLSSPVAGRRRRMRVRRVVVPRRNQLHVLRRVVAGHARDVDRRRARNENHLFVRRISVSKINVNQKHNFETSVVARQLRSWPFWCH